MNRKMAKNMKHFKSSILGIFITTMEKETCYNTCVYAVHVKTNKQNEKKQIA